MNTRAENALEVAKTQVGQKEKPLGSNWGKPIQDYLKSVGIGFPASWCMAFVYWCFDREQGNPLVKTGGVMKAWNESAANRVKVPQPGDIFIMDFGKGLGHTGIVEKVAGEFVHTIEGNTNDTGSREGIEVARRKRPINKMKGFLRYT